MVDVAFKRAAQLRDPCRTRIECAGEKHVVEMLWRGAS